MLGSKGANFGSFGTHARNVSIAKQSFFALITVLAIVTAIMKSSRDSSDDNTGAVGAAIVAGTMTGAYFVLSGLCLAAFIMACVAVSRCQ